MQAWYLIEAQPMDPYDNDPPGDDAFDAGEELFAGYAPDAPAEPAGFAPLPAPPAAPDAGDRLAFDLPCIECGYNLRGQLPRGSCPECGAPVARSNRTDQLARANPAWLATLKHAMTWMLVGVAAYIFIFVAIMAVAIASIGSFLPSLGNPNPAPSTLLTVVSVAGTLIYAVIFGVAYWQLTTPEPGAFTPRTSCGITRYTMVPAFAVSLIATVAAAPATNSAEIISGVFQVIALLLMLVGLPASMVYMRTLAVRVPDMGLSRQTSILLWGIPISVGTFIGGAFFLGLVTATSSSAGPGGAAVLTMLFACPAMIAIVVFSIWWIVLMCLYRVRFGQAHAFAQSQGGVGVWQ